MDMREEKKAYLLMADGVLYQGYSFGAAGTAVGELVFNTNMVGYGELLTNPASRDQLIVQTFPLIGNYGVNSQDMESSAVHAAGYLVREWCEKPSNFRCEGGIDGFMKKHGTVGIYGIDTRALTRKLRDCGSMPGMITTEDAPAQKEALLGQLRAWKPDAGIIPAEKKALPAQGDFKKTFQAAVLNLGCASSAFQALQSRGCSLTVFQPDEAAGITSGSFDGVFLSGGSEALALASVKAVQPAIQECVNQKTPVFAVGAGHLLLAAALGLETQKMHSGHRGSNQPVTDTRTGKTFITAQNHGYIVLADGLTDALGTVSHVDANDRTCEGIQYASFPGFSLQFEPDTREGSLVTENFYDAFTAMMDADKQ